MNWGLLEPGNSNYRDWMNPAVEPPPPELPEDFRTSPRPYRSAFDPSEW